MAGRFAEGTSVSPERSQAEISETLRRYGATGFMFGWENQHAMIGFRANDRSVKFVLELPDPDDPEFRRTPTGQQRNADGAKRAHEAETRRRWRALALAIKAKLEAVETGVTTFDEEFLAHLVLPDGSQVAQRLLPELEKAWKAGTMPPRLLPQIGGTR
jgi:hypothetical protein